MWDLSSGARGVCAATRRRECNARREIGALDARRTFAARFHTAFTGPAMNRRNSIVVRAVGFVSAFTAAVLLVACSDKLTAGSACPDLCSQEEIAVRDTVISAIEVDTSIVGFPTIGSENFLLLASLGDTLDTRVVVRYDTLPTTYRNVTAAADSNIVRVDSARLNVRIVAPSAQPAAPFTVEAYNVDTTAADTAAAPILAL